MNPEKFFKNPTTPGQKQYEALRAFYIEKGPGREVARKFGYTYSAFNSLKQRFKNDDLYFFFTPQRGPKGARVSSEDRMKIIDAKCRSF